MGPTLHVAPTTRFHPQLALRKDHKRTIKVRKWGIASNKQVQAGRPRRASKSIKKQAKNCSRAPSKLPHVKQNTLAASRPALLTTLHLLTTLQLLTTRHLLTTLHLLTPASLTPASDHPASAHPATLR
jgi:hypothetical protein